MRILVNHYSMLTYVSVHWLAFTREIGGTPVGTRRGKALAVVFHRFYTTSEKILGVGSADSDSRLMHFCEFGGLRAN
jgi:hypothetical protein